MKFPKSFIPESMFFWSVESCFAIYPASDSYPIALLGRRCFPSSGLKERFLQTSDYHPSPMGTHGLLGCCPGWSGWPGGSEDLNSKLANAFRSNVNSNANHTELESPLQKDNINITIAIPVTITFTVTATVTITYCIIINMTKAPNGVLGASLPLPSPAFLERSVKLRSL